jgi:hypothetical protein
MIEDGKIDSGIEKSERKLTNGGNYEWKKEY